MNPHDDSGFLPPHGNYSELLSFQKAEIVYGITFRYCHKYLQRRPHCGSDDSVGAKIALCLIHQANYLLDQQIRRLERDFIKEGGLQERMTKVRLRERGK